MDFFFAVCDQFPTIGSPQVAEHFPLNEPRSPRNHQQPAQFILVPFRKQAVNVFDFRRLNQIAANGSHIFLAGMVIRFQCSGIRRILGQPILAGFLFNLRGVLVSVLRLCILRHRLPPFVKGVIPERTRRQTTKLFLLQHSIQHLRQILPHIFVITHRDGADFALGVDDNQQGNRFHPVLRRDFVLGIAQRRE